MLSGSRHFLFCSKTVNDFTVVRESNLYSMTTVILNLHGVPSVTLVGDFSGVASFCVRSTLFLGGTGVSEPDVAVSVFHC